MIDPDFAAEAVRRVAAVRDAVGPDIRLMLDLSGGLTPDETIRLCHRWEKHDILFVEEPADPADIGALKRIAQAISIPIAAGERFYTRHDFRDALEGRAMDIAQPDIGNTGGIMETKKIAAMAEAYGLRVQPHICGGPIATAAALQIDACIPNFMIQELYPYRPRALFDLVDDAPDAQVVQGRMKIPQRPGLGVELRREAAAPFLWAEC
jgi:galactonate dehydratase